MSCRANASSPESWLPPPLRTLATAVSKIVVPVRRVWRNAASSPTAIWRMRLTSSLSSGYCGAIVRTEASTSSRIVGSWAPRRRIMRMVRRMMRRST